MAAAVHLLCPGQRKVHSAVGARQIAQAKAQRRISIAGTSHRARGRKANRGGEGQPLETSSRHHGPGNLQTWPTCIGTGRPSLGSGRPRTRFLHVRKLKNGSPATHPLTGKELRALRRLQREQELKSPFVFTSERGTPFTKRGFQAMVERAGKATGFDMKIHPHMLRHACGFKLANDGVDTRTIQAYLGHKSIQHTVRYTELAPTRFKNLFRD